MRTTTIAIALVAVLALVGLTGCGGESAAQPASTTDKSVTVKDDTPAKLPAGHPPMAMDANDGGSGCPALEKSGADAGCGGCPSAEVKAEKTEGCGDSCGDSCGESCGGCDEKKKPGIDN